LPLLAAADLANAILAAVATPLRPDPFYRSVDFTAVANLGVRILDGSRAGLNGGRYNAPGSQPTAYFAGTQTLAAFECEQEALVLGTHLTARNPRLTVAVSVGKAVVLDLTKQLVLYGFGLDLADLLKPTTHWRHENSLHRLAETQVIAEAARLRPDVDGLRVPSWLSGLILPSVLPRMENLVLFMDPLAPHQPRRAGVRISIHDPTGLVQ
jgi:RES domain-containing protein